MTNSWFFISCSFYSLENSLADIYHRYQLKIFKIQTAFSNWNNLQKKKYRFWFYTYFIWKLFIEIVETKNITFLSVWRLNTWFGLTRDWKLWHFNVICGLWILNDFTLKMKMEGKERHFLIWCCFISGKERTLYLLQK